MKAGPFGKLLFSVPVCVMFCLLSTAAFPRGDSLHVSVSVKGYGVPRMFVCTPSHHHSRANNTVNNLGPVSDGASVNTRVFADGDSFGLNFAGLSGENTYAVFQKDDEGDISFEGWLSGGANLWAHVNNRVSPRAIVIGPFETMINIYGFRGMCFFTDPINPYFYTLKEFDVKNTRLVHEVPPEKLLEGVVYKDYQYEGRPCPDSRLAVAPADGTAELRYAFEPGDVFESCFARIEADTPKSNVILMDVESDGSKNNFFVIVHDASGEQHLVLKTSLLWQGWEEVGIHLGYYFESSETMERFAIHWGGANNQKIDFPIKAIDIGVAKQDTRVSGSGQLRFRNIRFME